MLCAGNRGAFASTPGAFSSAPPSSSQAGLDAIDSKGYLMDILNLSVDLDPDDEDDVSKMGVGQSWEYGCEEETRLLG